MLQAQQQRQRAGRPNQVSFAAESARTLCELRSQWRSLPTPPSATPACEWLVRRKRCQRGRTRYRGERPYVLTTDEVIRPCVESNSCLGRRAYIAVDVCRKAAR